MTTTHPFAELSESLAATVERIAPSTLALRGSHRRGIATATVWGEGGIAVTAAHALRHGSSAALTLVGDGGRTVDASLVGTDASTDIAVLRLADASVPAVNAGDAASVRCGHLVLAVGRSGDGEPSASYGLVNRASGPWQTWLGGQLDRLIRLDGGLYDGLSGAPVADAHGSVIGMASAALSRSHGIVVPAATVSRVVRLLLAQGHVARGFIGVGAQAVDLPGDAGGSGLLVTALLPDGPAQRAGLMVGDVLLRIDAAPVRTLQAMRAALAGKVGSEADVDLRRGGVETTLRLQVGHWPARQRHC